MGHFVATVQRARDLLALQSAVLTNSSALAASGVVTASFGFLFWWIAARRFSPHSVGFASAAISIMSLIALAGELGLGTLLMGEARRQAKQAGGLIAAALIAVLASTMLFAIAWIGLTRLSFLSLGNVFESADGWGMFVLGCALTGFTMVLDGAFVGLLQSYLQALRNTLFSVFKVGLLLAAAFASSDHATTILLAWVIGHLLSIVLLAGFLISNRRIVWCSPDFGGLRRLVPLVLRHHLLNLVTQTPGLILPFLVTVVFAADANAAFYAAWMIINVILLVPGSLAATLFSIGAVEPAMIAHRLKFSLLLCALVSVSAAASLFLFGGWILHWFGPSYAAMGSPVLQILGLSTFGASMKCHFITIQRLKGRMTSASILLGAGGIIQILFAMIGAHFGGLPGLAWGWVGAVCLEAVIVAPTLLKSLRGVEVLEITSTVASDKAPISFRRGFV